MRKEARSDHKSKSRYALFCSGSLWDWADNEIALIMEKLQNFTV
jgi:hypothetical protein